MFKQAAQFTLICMASHALRTLLFPCMITCPNVTYRQWHSCYRDYCCCVVRERKCFQLSECRAIGNLRNGLTLTWAENVALFVVSFLGLRVGPTSECCKYSCLAFDILDHIFSMSSLVVILDPRCTNSSTSSTSSPFSR